MIAVESIMIKEGAEPLRIGVLIVTISSLKERIRYVVLKKSICKLMMNRLLWIKEILNDCNIEKEEIESTANG